MLVYGKHKQLPQPQVTIKKLIQTRWRIEPDSITIYPYGAIYIMCVLVGIVTVLWMLLMVYAIHEPFLNVIAVLWPVTLLYLLMIVFFWLFGRTAIVFDREQKMMYKFLFGFFRTTALPFADIAGITLMRNARGTFRYYVITQEPKWGDTGTGISSAVMNENSPHALDFREHVLTAINNYLHNKPGHHAIHYKKK